MVKYVSEDYLQGQVDTINLIYPWMKDYPVTCHTSCAAWEIDGEFGPDVRRMWEVLDNALWILNGTHAGKKVEYEEPLD